MEKYVNCIPWLQRLGEEAAPKNVVLPNSLWWGELCSSTQPCTQFICLGLFSLFGTLEHAHTIELYIYEHTKVPPSSECTWTPFYHPRIFKQLSCMSLLQLYSLLTRPHLNLGLYQGLRPRVHMATTDVERSFIFGLAATQARGHDVKTLKQTLPIFNYYHTVWFVISLRIWQSQFEL